MARALVKQLSDSPLGAALIGIAGDLLAIARSLPGKGLRAVNPPGLDACVHYHRFAVLSRHPEIVKDISVSEAADVLISVQPTRSSMAHPARSLKPMCREEVLASDLMLGTNSTQFNRATR